MTEEKKIEMYLQFWDEFLTIERFAEYHEISEDDAQKIVDEGRELFNKGKD